VLRPLGLRVRPFMRSSSVCDKTDSLERPSYLAPKMAVRRSVFVPAMYRSLQPLQMAAGRSYRPHGCRVSATL
jgi:hypothetical protein